MRVIYFLIILCISSSSTLAGSGYGYILYPDGSKLYIVQSGNHAMRSYLTKVDAKGKVKGQSCMREDTSAMQIRRARMVAKAKFVRGKVPAKFRRCL